MSNISKLRDAADLLLSLGNYEEAYCIYDEIYCQIWNALGTVQSGITEFSFSFLTHNIRPSIDFRNQFLEPAVNTIFVKWFNLDIDQTLNEFIFTVYGHLQCICYSQSLIAQLPSQTILSEFLILYNLIYHSTNDKWITHLLRYISPIIDSNRLKKIRINLPEEGINRQLLHLAEKIKFTDWNSLNQFMLEYIGKTSDRNSEFFITLQNISGFASFHSKSYNNRYDKKSTKEKRQKSYEKYERYEKYEKYERYEKKDTSSEGQSKFDSTGSTEEEKIKYYGAILGLKGRVTKSDIRKKYLEEISKYHPDRVQNLGEEIVNFAEQKTKEINAAYDWLKIKFKL